MVKEAATRIQRMQKALTQMNLQLHTVITDLTGTTGLNIVRSILAGVHDPEQLAVHRDPRCKADKAELVAALTSNYRAEHLFSLRQNFAAYEFHLGQIADLADVPPELEWLASAFLIGEVLQSHDQRLSSGDFTHGKVRKLKGKH